MNLKNIISGKFGLPIILTGFLLIFGFVIFFKGQSLWRFDEIEANNQQKRMLYNSKTKSTEISGILKDLTSDMYDLSKNESFINKNPASDLLINFFEKNKNILYSAQILDNKGTVLVKVPELETTEETLNFSTRPDVKFILENYSKYEEEVKAGQYAYISPLFTLRSGEIAISLCTPFFKGSNFIGILRGVVLIKTLESK